MNWRMIVGAAALMLGLAACGDDPAGNGTLECDAGTLLCDGSCSDTSTDARNCGDCGVACGAGEVCSAGGCTASCPGDQAVCEGGCFELASDTRHCGACGTECAAGEACDDGSCVAACPGNQVVCEGGCFDLDDDRQHCGQCGVSCGAGETCSGGVCEASCPDGQVVCGGGCFDLDTSSRNCGACGEACSAGEVCGTGVCRPSCGDGLSACDGTCRNLADDPANCGACDTACGDSHLCVDGSCEIFCASGLAACGGSCHDPENDRNHCGGCGIACADAEVCTEGSCVAACNGFASERCDDGCTNTASDPLNCGGCGITCEEGEVCSAGSCAGSCAPALTDCAGGCTSVEDDPSNCGACGDTCTSAPDAAAVCVGGSCGQSCLAGQADCNGDLHASGGNGCETTLATDIDHCGGCGISCPATPNATRACASGACGIGQCTGNFLNCDNVATNGCEVNPRSDARNCGACGVVCAATEYCAAGSCADRTIADDCTAPPVLTEGTNTIHWYATQNDFIPAPPSCSTSANYLPDGPDLVFQYTAGFTGDVELDFNPPNSTRWHAIVADGTCGDLSSEQVCMSDSGSLSGSFSATNGTTYYIYLVDSTSGNQPLRNPIAIDVTEFNCPILAPTAIGFSPADGATNTTLTGTFQATFSHAVNKTAGTFSLSGSRGTLRTFPFDDPAVTFAANGRSVTIEGGDFIPNEQVTITWTGITDAVCSKPVPPPAWVVGMPQPACTPGVGNMAGTTMTRMSLGLLPGASFSETTIAADDDPNGFVYIGSTGEIYRLPKSGAPTAERVFSGSTHLGYHLAIDGQNIYSSKNSSTALTGQLYRLSEDGGLTWDPVDMLEFAVKPPNSLNGLAIHNGVASLITFAGPGLTTIWSADLTQALPATPVLEADFSAETRTYQFCGGLAADDHYLYTTCRHGNSGSPYKILRIDRTTNAITELGSAGTDNQIMGSPIRVADLDGDGSADFLYQKGQAANVRYVCTPQTTPYVDELVSYGVSTSNTNGLDYDSALNAVWVYDDKTLELIKIQ